MTKCSWRPDILVEYALYGDRRSVLFRFKLSLSTTNGISRRRGVQGAHRKERNIRNLGFR